MLQELLFCSIKDQFSREHVYFFHQMFQGARLFQRAHLFQTLEYKQKGSNSNKTCIW